MPKNVPPELEEKFASCKEKVIASGQDEDAAYGICYMSVVEGKSLQDAHKSYYLDAKSIKSASMRDMMNKIEKEFHAKFSPARQNEIVMSPPQSYFYVVDFFDGYVIAEKDGAFYKVSYTENEGQISFSDTWEKVEEKREWVSKKAIKAGRMISRANAEIIKSIISLAKQLVPEEEPETEESEQEEVEPVEEMKSELLVSYGSAVKSINGKPGGYAVRFGGQDLTGDTFAADTNFGFAGETARKVDILLHHAQPMETKSGRRVQVTEPIGQATLKMSDDGVLIEEAILFNAENYAKHLDKLGWSTGAAAHSVVREGGTIKQWQIAEVSLTPIPAEPRNMVAAKSLAGEIVDMDDEALPDFREIGRQVGAELAQKLQQIRQSAG